MRMNTRVRRGERGAVLILVAVFAIVAVIFLAFVVDIGNQRQDRRQLATATDASALDVATRWSDAGLAKLANFTLISGNAFKGVYDCTSDAQDFLDRNRQVDAGDYECRAEILSPRLASVRVFAEGETNYQVAPAIGIDQGSIGSSTAVKITANPFGGLRPFAVCASQPAFNTWYSSPAAQDPNTVTRVTISGDKFLPAECGQNNGNWGFVQFETQDGGTGNGNDNKLAGTLRNGSDDVISPYLDSVGNTHRQRCSKSYAVQKSDHGAVSCIFDTNGAGGWNNNNTMQAFNHLIGPPAVTFALPIYDRIVDLGGSSTGFPVIGFAEARLVSFVQGGSKDNSITLDLIRVWTTQPGFIGANNRVLEICDVGSTSGAQLASFGTACQPAAAAGGSTPPVGSSDPCVVNSVSPGSQFVPVSAGSSTGPVSVDVTVADASRCAGMTVAADRQATNTNIGLPNVTSTGNVFRFTRTSGAPFGAAGQEYVVQVIQGGSLRHDLARMTTSTSVTPVCTVGTPFWTTAPSREFKNGAYTDKLDAAFVVKVPLTNPALCGTVTVRISRTGASETASSVVGSTATEVSFTFSASGNFKWLGGTYAVQAVRNGADVTGATASFDLPS